MKLYKFIFILTFLSHVVFADEIHRYGTTAANFLEIGIGSASGGMGEAYVAVANDLSAIYWNPAGLSSLKGVGIQFMIQPWVVNINTIFAAGAINVPRIGTFALSLTQIGYGQMDVTTLAYQEGTGEKFTSNELALTFSFGRRLVPWFSFGANVKLVQSNIWHASANAFALDLGVLVNTHFFSVTGEKVDGMVIGMCISNFGTRMKYDGIDLYQPIDISEYEEGNYGDVAGQFRTQEWELPLLFRIGVAVKPIVSNFATLTLAADAAFKFKFPGNGAIVFRGGQKALYMDEPQFGLTGGLGLEWNFLNNRKIIVDYAYKTMGILGNVHATTIGLNF